MLFLFSGFFFYSRSPQKRLSIDFFAKFAFPSLRLEFCFVAFIFCCFKSFSLACLRELGAPVTPPRPDLARQRGVKESRTTVFRVLWLFRAAQSRFLREATAPPLLFSACLRDPRSAVGAKKKEKRKCGRRAALNYGGIVFSLLFGLFKRLTCVDIKEETRSPKTLGNRRWFRTKKARDNK